VEGPPPQLSGRLLLLITAAGVLVAVVQLGALTIAFDKLGLSAHSAFLLLISSLLGSMLNLPLFSVPGEAPPDGIPPALRHVLDRGGFGRNGRTLIAVNVGGCVIPAAFSLYLLTRYPLPLGTVALAVCLVSLICYGFSRPIQGLGIGMPMLVAPVSAALLALLLDPAHSAPLAYISGTLGVLIGADLLRLREIRGMGAPVASIGGAGTFDGIFVTGLVAVLLA